MWTAVLQRAYVAIAETLFDHWYILLRRTDNYTLIFFIPLLFLFINFIALVLHCIYLPSIIKM